MHDAFGVIRSIINFSPGASYALWSVRGGGGMCPFCTPPPPVGPALTEYRRTSSVTSILQELGWEDLQLRRDQNKAKMTYRIVNYLIEIPAGQYLNATGVATRGHRLRLLSIYCSNNAYKGSFFSSKVRLWNSLPASVIVSTNFGRLQGPCWCRYPKTVTVNNMFLSDFNCI